MSLFGRSIEIFFNILRKQTLEKGNLQGIPTNPYTSCNFMFPFCSYK